MRVAIRKAALCIRGETVDPSMMLLCCANVTASVSLLFRYVLMIPSRSLETWPPIIRHTFALLGQISNVANLIVSTSLTSWWCHTVAIFADSVPLSIGSLVVYMAEQLLRHMNLVSECNSYSSNVLAGLVMMCFCTLVTSVRLSRNRLPWKLKLARRYTQLLFMVHAVWLTQLVALKLLPGNTLCDGLWVISMWGYVCECAKIVLCVFLPLAIR